MNEKYGSGHERKSGFVVVKKVATIEKEEPRASSVEKRRKLENQSSPSPLLVHRPQASPSPNPPEPQPIPVPQEMVPEVIRMMPQQTIMSEILQQLQGASPPIKFLDVESIPLNFFGMELDNGTFGYVKYCRSPGGVMGKSVAKFFFDTASDIPSREVYALW